MSYKIVELHIENLRKISAVDITPETSVVKVEGKNSQGKSTILDCIDMALRGGSISKDVIKNGEDKATIIADIGDYVVRRVINKDGNNSLEVRDKSNKFKKINRPKEFLDALIGNLAFDPMQFKSMNGKEQTDLLLKALNIDLKPLQEEYNSLTEERKDEKRLLKKYEAMVEEYAGAKKVEKVNTIDLVSSLEEIHRKINTLHSEQAQYKSKVEGIEEAKNEIEQIKVRIQELEKYVKTQTKEASELKKDFNGEINKLNAEHIDIRKKLDNAEGINTEADKYRLFKEREAEFRIQENKVEDLEKAVKASKEKQVNLLNDAKLPMKGLMIEEGNLMLEGVPFDQLAESVKLKVSLNVAMSLNPDIRVALIREGSSLDSDNLKIVSDWAKTNDFQIWIERVSDVPISDDSTMFIEEGKILTKEERKAKIKQLLNEV